MEERILSGLPPDQRRIVDKILQEKRIDSKEGLKLYTDFELSVLGILANYVREKYNGQNAYFNRNIHLEPTNICIHNCMFCSYSRKINEEGSWESGIEEIKEKLISFRNLDITEIHIVGGVHPNRNVEYYAKLISTVKKELPGVHIKAFTAAEIEHMAKKAGLGIREALRMLMDAGLESLPGGGAEIFDENLRKKICPDKTSSEKWLDVHRQAHLLNIPTNCTMLYGHLESYEHRIDHLNRLRTLQDETGGFNAFIPLKYRSFNNELSHIGEVNRLEDLKNYAVSRIFLDNIPHLKAYWPMIGKDIALLSLSFGVDDLDGTIKDSTKIYTMAGSEEKNPDMTAEEITRLIKMSGRTPVERDSLYQAVKIFT